MVTVNNVAPIIALSGDAGVDEGSSYTLNLAALVDPGVDTPAGYSIDWGDGAVENFTPAEYALLGGNAQHTYADGETGGTSRTIEVSVTDEDGAFLAGSKTITVNNVAPTAVLSGIGSLNEGDTYTLHITGSDPAGLNDSLSYSIDWGDGSAPQLLSAAELLALSGNVEHLFSDDEDGLVNATDRTIQVTVSDEDGGSSTSSKVVTVNNVAPTIVLSGDASVNEGSLYTLNLGAVTDPGVDVVTQYIVDWGDGSASESFAATGDVTHAFMAANNYTVSVNLVDEDGTHVDAGSLAVTVNDTVPVETIRIGDAPTRVTRSNPDAIENAWTDDAISITHKADYTDAGEAWSSATLDWRNTDLLPGGDIFGGDLGVSGQSLVSSTIRQEIDGTEALRFDFNQSATSVSISLSRLNGDNATNNFDAGRLELLDDAGVVVSEFVFQADGIWHEQEISLDHAEGFSSVVLTAGVYENTEFVFGGLANATGLFQSQPVDLGDGSWEGSDYLVDAIEFEFGAVIAPLVSFDDDPSGGLL